MVGRCGRSLSLILTILTLWPSGVEGQGQQQGQVDSQGTSHLALCLQADGDQHVSAAALRTQAAQIERNRPARFPLTDDVATVGRAEVRLAVRVITRYVTEQAVGWVHSLIASQPRVEE
jgi:hypothetical protein